MSKWIDRLAVILEYDKAKDAPVSAPTKPTEHPSRPVVSVLSVGTPSAFQGVDATPGPFALSTDDGDRAHETPWDEDDVARYVARVMLFMTRTINATDADDLAERLHLRDVDRDAGRDLRVVCIECRHYRPRRADDCANHANAGARVRGRAAATMLQGCPGFAGAELQTAQDVEPDQGERQ